MLGYAKVCIYTNNQLDASTLGGDTGQTLLATTPNARIQSIGQEEYLPDNLRDQFSKVTPTTVTKFLSNNGYCPQPKLDELVYAINTRLNPSTAYTLKFTVKDIYGNTLAPITKTFTTEKMKDKDKFLYIGYPDKNTLPKDVPLMVNIQSINTSTATISVCAMDVENYIQNKNNALFAYDESGNQVASPETCNQSFTKDIVVKNNNRLLSNTRVDIEKDIAKTTIPSPIIRVVGSLKTNDPIANKR